MSVLDLIDGVAMIIELEGCFDNVVTSDDSVFIDTMIVEVVAIELEDDPVIYYNSLIEILLKVASVIYLLYM